MLQDVACWEPAPAASPVASSSFDDGRASEFNTLLVTDWFAHTPSNILAKNFGVPATAFNSIPLHDL
jgi:hypothetical protein